jgi:hypothetical protein
MGDPQTPPALDELSESQRLSVSTSCHSSKKFTRQISLGPNIARPGGFLGETIAAELEATRHPEVEAEGVSVP